MARLVRRVSVLACVVCLASLVGSGFAHAAGFGASVTGLWLTVSGVDETVGSEGVYEVTEQWPVEIRGFGSRSEGDTDSDGDADGDGYDEMTLYSVAQDPIVLSPSPTSGEPLAIKYDAWIEPGTFIAANSPGLRLSYWGVERTASASGSAAGMSKTETEGEPDGEGYSVTHTTPGVEMWGEDFYSYWYALFYRHHEGYYDDPADPGSWTEEEVCEFDYYDPQAVSTDWNASTSIKSSTADILLDFPVLKTPDSALSVLGGLRRATWEETLEQAVSGTFHDAFLDCECSMDFTPFGPPWYGPLEEPDNGAGGIGSVYAHLGLVNWHNDYSLDAASNVQFTGIGPEVGLMGSSKLGRSLKVSGKVTHSYVKGTAVMTGSFHDVDDYLEGPCEDWPFTRVEVWVKDPEGNEIEPFCWEFDNSVAGLYEGTAPVEVSGPTSIGITELELGVEAELGTGLVSFFLWGGYFGSLWTGVPLAPTFDYATASWDTSRRTDVFFGGPALKAGIRF